MARSVAMTNKTVRRPSFSKKEPRIVSKLPLVWKKHDQSLRVGPYDVLSGRDNDLPGNVAFRGLVASYSKIYQTVAREEKKAVAEHIVERVYEKGGIFYRKNQGVVAELPKKRAIVMVQQLFRQKSAAETDSDTTNDE